jgi:hypothetical protein
MATDFLRGSRTAAANSLAIGTSWRRLVEGGLLYLDGRGNERLDDIG